jgi:hypothetical protein
MDDRDTRNGGSRAFTTEVMMEIQVMMIVVAKARVRQYLIGTEPTSRRLTSADTKVMECLGTTGGKQMMWELGKALKEIRSCCLHYGR